MSLHVVVGAGPVGSAIACLLAGRGDQVRLVTRSGSGPEHRGVDRRKADATDPEALARLADGAAVLYHCAGPAYHRWPTEFPPLSAAVLRAAEMPGAVPISAANLYGYGPVAGPITEDLPVRPELGQGPVHAGLFAAPARRAHRRPCPYGPAPPLGLPRRRHADLLHDHGSARGAQGAPCPGPGSIWMHLIAGPTPAPWPAR